MYIYNLPPLNNNPPLFKKPWGENIVLLSI